MILIAHRCGTDKYPEATIEAAKYSLELGADFVEIDVRYTRDSVPVISHDANVTRLFGRGEKISSLSAEDFSNLRYRENPDYRPRLLEEFFSAGVAPLLFHVKEGGEDLAKLLGFVERRRYGDKVVFGVSALSDVEIVKNSKPSHKVLAFMPKPEDAEAFISAGADFIRLWEPWVTLDRIEAIHASKRGVWIMAGEPAEGSVGYTTRERAAYFKGLGADGFLINDVALYLNL